MQVCLRLGSDAQAFAVIILYFRLSYSGCHTQAVGLGFRAHILVLRLLLLGSDTCVEAVLNAGTGMLGESFLGRWDTQLQTFRQLITSTYLTTSCQVDAGHAFVIAHCDATNIHAIIVMVSHLEHVILHNISNDAILIKVTPSALCAKGFLETDLHHKMSMKVCAIAFTHCIIIRFCWVDTG